MERRRFKDLRAVWPVAATGGEYRLERGPQGLVYQYHDPAPTPVTGGRAI